MLCKHARLEMESASSPEEAAAALTRHVSACGPCRRLFGQRRQLRGAMARLRSETNQAQPSGRVEGAVMAALERRHVLPQAAGNLRRWPYAGALAVLTLLVVALAITMHRSHSVAPAEPAGEAFTAMPYVIAPAPYERTSIVRTEVPLHIMQSAGFQVRGDDPASTTPADVLYGEDGRILAIRLVSQPGGFILPDFTNPKFSHSRMD